MKNSTIITKNECRNINGGGKLYRCRHCGFTSSSYWRTYANALKCVTRKYGGAVWRIASAIF